MKTPTEATKELATRYNHTWRTWASGAGLWPLTLTLQPPVRKAIDTSINAVDDWARTWTDFERAHPDATVDWVTRRTVIGNQQLPHRLTIPTPQVLATVVGKASQWETATRRYQAITSNFPDAQDAARSCLTELTSLTDTDFANIVAVTHWLRDHPRSGLMPRQLPIEGIHTKWVARHYRVLRSLTAAATSAIGVDFDASLPSDADSSEADDRKLNALGLRPRPTYVRVALLDPAHRTRFAGVTDLAISAEQLPDLELQPSHLVIIENLETALTLPNLIGTVIIHSLGHNLEPLRNLEWAKACPSITYWGDLDVEGFAILDRLRSLGYDATSILMDAATLEKYRHLAVTEEKQPRRRILKHLTPEEVEAYEGLLANTWGERLRLEQERIPLREGIYAIEIRALEEPRSSGNQRPRAALCAPLPDQPIQTTRQAPDVSVIESPMRYEA